MTAELPPPSPSHHAAPPLCFPRPRASRPPPLRASHADRDLAVEILRVAMGDGRLTVAELDERLEAALTARTIDELAALTADLPGGATLQATCQAHACENPAELWPSDGPAWTPLTVTPTGQLAADRWAFVRSLLSEPRRYELLTG